MFDEWKSMDKQRVGYMASHLSRTGNGKDETDKPSHRQAHLINSDGMTLSYESPRWVHSIQRDHSRRQIWKWHGVDHSTIGNAIDIDHGQGTRNTLQRSSRTLLSMTARWSMATAIHDMLSSSLTTSVRYLCSVLPNFSSKVYQSDSQLESLLQKRYENLPRF